MIPWRVVFHGLFQANNKIFAAVRDLRECPLDQRVVHLPTHLAAEWPQGTLVRIEPEDVDRLVVSRPSDRDPVVPGEGHP